MSQNANTTAPLAISSLIPRQIRADLADTIEEIGQAMGLLRESIDDTERGNGNAGQMCGSDALEIIASLEAKFSAMAASLAAWTEVD